MNSSFSRWVFALAGLFVVLGVGALVLTGLSVGVSKSFRSASVYRVYAYFDDASGLLVDAQVAVSGVEVGRVSSITLDPKSLRAKVALDLLQSVPLSKDTSAAIFSKSLLGGKYVTLTPGGDSANLVAGDVISDTQSSLGLEQLIQQFIGGSVKK